MKLAWKPAFLAAALSLVAASTAGGCSTSSGKPTDAGSGGDGSCVNGGGPVPGDVDQHCADTDGNPIVQKTTAAACMDSTAGGAGAGGADAGEEEDAPARFNSEGDDDDCKYHVAFSTTCIEQNTDVTLTVHVDNLVDGSPLVGAATQTEIYLSDTHLAPNTHPQTKVVSPGVYSIGPIRFDQAGRWTVRFHFFESCLDARPDSPHGHAAFYVDVP